MDKLPPVEKVYEAWTAIEDGHVQLAEDGSSAAVTSSDGTKTYEVRRVEEDGRTVYRSNDNATYWQGYAGYPVIAMLMVERKLPLDLTVAGWFAGVDWHSVNAAHGNDYAAAVAQVETDRDFKKERITHAREEAERVMEALKGLDIAVGRNGHAVRKN